MCFENERSSKKRELLRKNRKIGNPKIEGQKKRKKRHGAPSPLKKQDQSLKKKTDFHERVDGIGWRGTREAPEGNSFRSARRLKRK